MATRYKPSVVTFSGDTEALNAAIAYLWAVVEPERGTAEYWLLELLDKAYADAMEAKP